MKIIISNFGLKSVINGELQSTADNVIGLVSENKRFKFWFGYIVKSINMRIVDVHFGPDWFVLCTYSGSEEPLVSRA